MSPTISPLALFSSRAGSSVTGAGGGTMIRVLLALAPVALPTAYLLFLKRSLARRTVVSARISPPDPPITSSAHGDAGAQSGVVHGKNEDGDTVIPPNVLNTPERYIVARERVTSHWLQVSALRAEFLAKKGNDLEGLLEAYLSATMRAFSWTPQALLMARMGPSGQDAEGYRRTFDTEYIGGCGFQPGDRVCGVYVVRARKGGKVVLDLAPPVGWKGPVVKGALVVGFERVGKDVRFVNETVMWRMRDGEKPTLLEGRAGRWLHTLMASWLVVRGVESVTMD